MCPDIEAVEPHQPGLSLAYLGDAPMPQNHPHFLIFIFLIMISITIVTPGLTQYPLTPMSCLQIISMCIILIIITMHDHHHHQPGLTLV